MKITKAQLSQIVREELTQVLKEQSGLLGDLPKFDVSTTPVSTPAATPSPEPETKPAPQPVATSPRVQAIQARQAGKTARVQARQAGRTARAPAEQTVGIKVPKGVPVVGGAGVTLTTKR